ncbi:hypothetical protein [Azospirillum agricola]|uniref:hypothetical protein n=1 Tax=Azospirillum agricola TaxID=1720247 RepID=UPI000A0F133B|nr:hypothetical protein [Azospirillum agricola]SMH31758.1 hypothetical protein SAMN02982994_0501 [Azospirillum lipoferum]
MTPAQRPSFPAPPAAGRLFRKAALDRLSVTEDLDRPPTLASPRGRRWLLGLAVLCLGVSVGLLA